VAKSQELDISNDCVRKSLTLLRDTYRPDRFPPMYEKLVELKGIKAEQLGGDLLAAV